MTPPQRLTPQSSIDALEKRFELGKLTKEGPEYWDGNCNQEKLDDRCWIYTRIRHGVRHIAHYEGILFGGVADDGDDDGAAIMWLGCMLHEAYLRRKAKANDPESR